jgi:aminopeptidase N
VVLRPAAWTDLWLTEALAHHLALDFVRAERGEGDAWAALAALGEAYLEEASRYRRPLVWDRFAHPADLADAHAWGRGTWFLRQLRGIVGEDAFGRALAALFARPGEAYTEDLQALLERSAGRRLADHFDAWVGGAGHPSIRLDARHDPAREMLTVRLRQFQDGPLVPTVFPIESRLAWRSLAGDGAVSVHLAEPETEIAIPLPLGPRFVELDPDGHLLAGVDTEHDLSARTAILRYGPVPARYRAALALADEADDPALPLALRMAYEEEAEPVVRRAIVRAALPGAPSASLESLARLAYGDSDAGVRALALRLLGGFGGREDLAAFVADAASRDTIQSVQAAAVEALASMGADDADWFARAALITGSDGDVIRTAGFRALAALPTSGSDLRTEVLKHSGADLPVNRILAALEIAGRLERSQAVGRRLLDLLRHPHYRVREAAAAAAARHLDARTIETRLDEEPDAGVRAALGAALRAARAGAAPSG